MSAQKPHKLYQNGAFSKNVLTNISNKTKRRVGGVCSILDWSFKLFFKTKLQKIQHEKIEKLTTK